MRKLRETIKYTLGVTALLAALLGVWSCTEETPTEPELPPLHEIPEGYYHVKLDKGEHVGDIPREMLDPLFRKHESDNTVRPPRNVTYDLSGGNVASQYSVGWMVQVKRFSKYGSNALFARVKDPIYINVLTGQVVQSLDGHGDGKSLGKMYFAEEGYSSLEGEISVDTEADTAEMFPNCKTQGDSVDWKLQGCKGSLKLINKGQYREAYMVFYFEDKSKEDFEEVEIVYNQRYTSGDGSYPPIKIMFEEDELVYFVPYGGDVDTVAPLWDNYDDCVGESGSC